MLAAKPPATLLWFLPPIVLGMAECLGDAVHGLALRYGDVFVDETVLIGPRGQEQEAMDCA